jgi:hypothetical protein
MPTLTGVASEPAPRRPGVGVAKDGAGRDDVSNRSGRRGFANREAVRWGRLPRRGEPPERGIRIVAEVPCE